MLGGLGVENYSGARGRGGGGGGFLNNLTIKGAAIKYIWLAATGSIFLQF